MKKIMICLMLALCVSSAAVGCGKKEEPKKTEANAESKKTKKEETKKEYQVIGNKTEDAFDILLKNSTGQDITAISVKTSDKTEYPASMMKTGETLKAGDTAELFYTPETGITEGTATTDKAINITYNAQVTLADGSVIELSSLGFADIKEEAELCYEDGVGFVKYVSKTSNDSVSTKEQELGAKAQREAAAAAAQAAADAAAQAAINQQAVENYSDSGYVEPSYTEPAYTEPAYTEPTYTEPVEQAPAQDSESCLNAGDLVINPQ